MIIKFSNDVFVNFDNVTVMQAHKKKVRQQETKEIILFHFVDNDDDCMNFRFRNAKERDDALNKIECAIQTNCRLCDIREELC